MNTTMTVTFYNQDSTMSYTISASQHIEKKETHVLIRNDEGEAGQFNAGEVSDVIYNALDKYFKEHY